MSRPLIFGIVCLCLFASTASVGWGQDYLDLPEEPASSGGPTLTDRFKSITGKFGRQPKQSQRSQSQRPQAKSSQRSNPRAPRYSKNSGHKSRQNSQVQRSRASQPSQQQRSTAATGRGQSNRGQSSNRSNGGNRSNSGVVSRPTTKDLLPDIDLFSRSNRSQTQYQPNSQAKALAKSASRKTHVSSRSSSNRSSSSRSSASSRGASSKSHAKTQTKSQSSPQRVARRSPTATRANELNAALAELLHSKPALKKKKVLLKTPRLAARTANNSFDLREALLAEDVEPIAEVVEPVVEKPIAKLPVKQPKTVSRPVAAPKPLVAKTQKTKSLAAALQAAPTAVVEQTPVIEMAPVTKPTIVEPRNVEPTVEQPKVKEPVLISEPIVIESLVKATPPKQAITIAAPQPSPRRSPKTANDPFEDSAKHVFRPSPTLSRPTSNSTSNPMRSFQPVIEKEQPSNEYQSKTIARPERRVLQTSEQPVIISRVEGPQSIMIGREATYQVTLENTSSTVASDLRAEINVPEWAELVDAMSTSGVVKRSDQGANAGVLEWRLNELEARSSQALRLRLIPRSGRPLQLGVRWSQAPVETQAIVEVQEPKLEITISGPKEVRYGKSQRYRLTLRNPGTGLTEQVSLRLIPPGGDAQSATTQKIGNLKPGEVRDLDLELTAREAGELLIQADASAEGGLKAEATKTVLCRKPELTIDWRGPDKKYAGTVAAYYFRVRNPGTAATEPVDMSIKLPVGAEFVSASEGFSIDTATGVVSWQLAGIEVNEEQFMQVRCKIVRPGMNDFELIAKTSDGELTDSKAFQTDVVALADLKLEVTDPQGPLPLGESIVYEIRVRNRGTTSAENIHIVSLFSEGIDPTTVEGAQFALRDGRVSFHPIKSLPAGREILLRINAKANKVGTHVFRTEVTCPDLDIKLAAEETTRFFEDEHNWQDGETPYTAERQSTTTR